jgi:membrane protease subunit HflK
MGEVVGDRAADEVITIGRQKIETEALTKVQTLSTRYAMGISIDQVQWKTSRRRSPSPGSRARVAATRHGSWDQGPMGSPDPLD